MVTAHISGGLIEPAVGAHSPSPDYLESRVPHEQPPQLANNPRFQVVGARNACLTAVSTSSLAFGSSQVWFTAHRRSAAVE